MSKGVIAFLRVASYCWGPAVSLEDEIQQRLDQVNFPGFRHSIWRYGLVQQVSVADGQVTVTLLPASRRPEITRAIAERVRENLSKLSAVQAVHVVAAAAGHTHGAAASAESQASVPGIKRIVAVSSAKGGVGKSTVAVNLAVALQRAGAKVALMDADVYGPSAPLMLGVEGRPRSAGNKITPIERYGVDVMSMGFFLDDSSPVIWRGPMVMGLVRQFLRDVEWGEQDYLIVDMPPGTGDAALTLAQQVPISGALIVTTPQDVALADVERGIAMFRQVQVPVLGIVENMSYYLCPDCGEREEVFGSGGGDALAKQFGVRVLAKLPLVPDVRVAGDAGRPIVLAAPDHAVSKQLVELARSVDQALRVG
jgi:ATP-binding protein involved in chromosome partitioning